MTGVHTWRHTMMVFAAIVAIAAACAIVYSTSFGNEFVFDDIAQIVNNTGIRSVSNLRDAFTHHLTYYTTDTRGKFYRPLQSVTLIWDYFLWGLTPFGYHLTNTLLHALVSILAFLFLARVTGRLSLAFIIALLYAVHPLHTEAVTYVSGRADSLSTIFLVLMLILQRRYWAAAAPVGKAIAYAGILGAFACGLLSKEYAVVFPLLLMVSEYCLRGPKGYTNVLGRRLLFYMPIAALLVIWLIIKNRIIPTETMVQEVSSFPTRLTNVWKFIFDYIRLSFVPVGLHMSYKIPFPRSLLQPGFFGPFLFGLAFIGYIAYVWRRGRTQTEYRIVFFGLAWFIVALLPYLNVFFLLNAPFAEHWVYVAEVGLITAVVCQAAIAARSRPWLGRALFALALIYIGLFSYKTMKHNLVWKDSLTFYSYSIIYSPYSEAINNNLAIEYLKRGDYARAKKYIEEALRIDPDYEVAKENLAALRARGY